MEERQNFKSDIADNVLSAIKTLLQNTTTESLIQHEELQEDVQIVELLPAKMQVDQKY